MGISGELYNLLENYRSGGFQRVVLNGQTSSRRPVLVGVLKVPFWANLFFLFMLMIYQQIKMYC